MKKDDKQLRVIVSGGGTGGHIFPAVSIANALKARTGAEILFVGPTDDNVFYDDDEVDIDQLDDWD